MSVLARRTAARPRRHSAAVQVGELFDEHAPMVLAICRYLLRDAHAAEDAAQETFLSAHRSLLAGSEPRDAPAWLATIARNECRRVWRTARPASQFDDATVAAVHDPADIVAERAELSEVANAIGKLPERQREALVLREFCGLSYAQVAAAMSVTEPVVDSLLSRARRGLTERVGYIPRAARGALVVPASFREELARLIPGLDPAGAATAAGVASGTGAAAAILGSGPAATKVAATGFAAVVLALPVQATPREKPHAGATARPPARPVGDAGRASPSPKDHIVLAPAPRVREAAEPRPSGHPAGPAPKTIDRSRSRSGHPQPTPAPTAAPSIPDSSGPGPAPSSETGSSGPGPGPAEATSSGPGPGGTVTVEAGGSGSSGPGSSGSGSSGSGSSGSDSSGSGSSGSDSSGSGSSGSASSGSDSSGSGSGTSSSGSSGSGSGSAEDAPDDD